MPVNVLGAGVSDYEYRQRVRQYKPSSARRGPLPPYVRLIHDVLLGDHSLFTCPDGLAAVWNVAEPLLSRPPQVRRYARRERGGPLRRLTSSHRGLGCWASSRRRG
jgi:glucose-6-phosphate 1-dehydrogenase